MPKKLIIAIDGPAGSGKSTTAKLLAQKLGYVYIDTGAMYRAVTFYSIKKNILQDNDKIVELAKTMDIELRTEGLKTNVFVNNENVTDDIRSIDVNKNVSDVSSIEGVRKVLVKKQQEMGSDGGVVMEGRDISTVVFPDADVKIFLTASIDERSARRAKEFSENGTKVSVDQIKENLASRDEIDSSREVSPLIKAADAVEVDTSNVTIEQQVDIILNEVKRTAERKNIKLNIN